MSASATIESGGASLAAPGPALWARQVVGLLGLEVPRRLLGRRAIGIWLLALAPVAIFAMKTIALLLFPDAGPRYGLAAEERIYAELFQMLLVRLCLFFGCVTVFITAIRGDVIDRSIHYHFLAPVRREVLVAGKYLSGLIVAFTAFAVATVVTRVLMYVPYGAVEASAHFLGGPGLRHTLIYLLIVALGCLAYGALFLAAGLVARNPIIPAVMLFGWESANIFLPPPLRQISVIYYLVSLAPVPVDLGPFSVPATPATPIAAMLALVLLSAVLLVWCGRRIRRMEVDYADD